MISFTVQGKPVAKGRPRMTRNGIAYTPEKTRQAEESFLAQALPHRPSEPLEGPLEVELYFCFPVPKSWSKKKRAAALREEVCPTGKPDLDNLVKIIDCLNGVFWRDDAQIINLSAGKFYGEQPRTEVYIQQSEGGA